MIESQSFVASSPTGKGPLSGEPPRKLKTYVDHRATYLTEEHKLTFESILRNVHPYYTICRTKSNLRSNDLTLLRHHVGYVNQV